jgi:hypothetical protein
MPVSTPQVLLEAIGSSAGPGFITNPMPNTPTGSNAASIEGGFPSITMESELTGGLPPLGQDMNGFLFLISSHTIYVQSGQLYPYNSTLAAAIGGYAVGTILGMADGTGIWLCTAANNTSNPDTGGSGWVPLAAYGFTPVAVTGGVTNLTTAESKYGVLVFNGVLVSNQTINLPTNVQQWLIINGTSGNFALTVKTASSGSAGVIVPQGGFGSPVGVYSIGDGNIYPTVAPLNLPIDQNPTPSTIVQRTNAGYVLATYFNASQPVDNGTINTVVTTEGDGFYRQNSLTNFEGQMLLQGIGGTVSNGQVPYSVVQQWVSTFLANAALTGIPTAPTAAFGTSNTQIATTGFANPGVTVNSNGTCIPLPNNYKLQFGTCNPNGGTAAITFPVAFSSAPAVLAISLAGAGVQTWLPSGNPPTAGGAHISNSGGSAIWFAIGI